MLAAKRLLAPKEIRSETIEFRVREARKPPVEPAAPEAKAKTPVFKGCSQTQQSTLDQALSQSGIIAAASLLILKGTAAADRPKCERYKTWFGTYSLSNWNTVTANFDKIHNALTEKTITFNCDCTQNWYAYVCPNNPYEVYIWKAFWNAPVTGTDSQAGTLVHEVSHFNIVAGADDHAYGQANCKNLAATNPSKAIANADSYEYFAENNPALKCGLALLPLALLVVLVLLLRDHTWFGTRLRGATRGLRE